MRSPAAAWIGAALCLAGLWAFHRPVPLRAAGAEADVAAVEFFERKVRPVLVANCHECHSSGKKRRGNLLLDSRMGLLKGGDTGPAAVPGEPAKSLLVKAISYTDELRMPPRGKLSAEQIADLTRWVQMGAPWPGDGKSIATLDKFDLEGRKKHWSFQPVRAATVPGVKDGAWPRTPIDRFLLARLEAKGLSPAPPADRRTLLRRLSFDLTGLPPTPGEMAAFLADDRPDAYERVVDRLLGSPAYGERQGRHWLDLVRFAETSGHEFDFEIPEAYRYRDYAVRAFNEDAPYDRLVREHIAGDLMAGPRRHAAEATNESILGTGFWFLGESKHSPVDLRGDGADRRDNMIDVFGKAFLGLTISCARCHDHKFDPIYTKDYYALVSYLQSARMQRAFLDHPDRIGKPAAALARLRQQAAREAIQQTAAALERRLSKLAEMLLRQGKERQKPDELFSIWQTLAAAESFEVKRRELAGSFAESRAGDVVFEDFAHGCRDWYVTGDAFRAAPPGPEDVELQPGGSLAVRRIARGAHSGLVSARLQGAIRSRSFTIEKNHLLYRVHGQGGQVRLVIDGFQQIRAPIYGGLQIAVRSPTPRWYVQDVSMWRGQRAYIEVLDDGNGFIELDRVVFSDHGPPAQRPNALLADLLEAASPEDLARRYQRLLLETVAAWKAGKLKEPVGLDLVNTILASRVVADLVAETDRPSPRLAELLQAIARQEATLPEPRRGLAMADGTPVHERVHIRGNPRTLGEEAPRRFPVVFENRESERPGGTGRLEMARRLTSADNPLFARVMVNRLWQQHFGAGIVRSPDDFGAQGERPTHPELLDWLAGEFVQSGWSLKHMHRLTVLSSAYRMASRADDTARAADPRNEWLHRMPIRRLEAEAIRDATLAVSGRLDRTMFGPGPLPYLTEFMIGRGRPAASGPLDGGGRRSIYLNVRRNFLNPMFLAFDYPVPFTTIGRRSVSNVPAQALTLLNNPFVAQQARLWADRVLAAPGQGDRERVMGMYESAFGRMPSEAELDEALAFLAEQGRLHGGKDLAAWADLAHVLFNVKEFLFVN